MSLENGSGQSILTLSTQSIYPSAHYQLIRTIFKGWPVRLAWIITKLEKNAKKRFPSKKRICSVIVGRLSFFSSLNLILLVPFLG